MRTCHETTIDRFGRVLIPKNIREILGLQPGSLLRIEQRNGEIALCPRAQEPVLVQKGRVLVARVEPLQDLTEIEKKLRRERLRRVADYPAK